MLLGGGSEFFRALFLWGRLGRMAVVPDRFDEMAHQLWFSLMLVESQETQRRILAAALRDVYERAAAEAKARG